MLTKEQAEQLYNLNVANLQLTFRSYYKYTFTFCGETEQIEVSANTGGNADDIYRYHVSSKAEPAPATFEFLIESCSGKIVEKSTGEVYEWDNYDY